MPTKLFKQLILVLALIVNAGFANAASVAFYEDDVLLANCEAWRFSFEDLGTSRCDAPVPKDTGFARYGERTTSSKGNANQSGELALRLNGLEHTGRKFPIVLSETFASHTGNMPKAPFLYNTVLSYNGSIRGSGSIIVGSASI